MFFYMLLITFTMIYAANIPPAAVFEDNDSFSAPNDFMIGSESIESLQKYITRDKYSKQLEPSMDTYVRAYKKFHEKYQTAEEKNMDEINRENQNSIDHKIRKRSAPQREMIKFELSDAKVPDFMTTKLMSTKVPPSVADAVYDSPTPTTEDVKSSGSRMIKIVHPIRSSRGLSLDTFSAPVSKASFKLYLNEKHNPLSYKGLYNPVSSRTRYTSSSRNFSQTDRTVSGTAQNQLGPLQTPGLQQYSGKNWKRPQSRPSAQYVPTVKKVPQFGYTIPPVSPLSNTLTNTLTVGSLSSLTSPQKTYSPLLQGATATDSNRFGEPFRSSLSDPTFSFDEEGLAALTALIGKAPKQQLQAFDELLKQDKTRPQDSTSPILFHPTTETSFRASTTPASVDFFPDSEAGRLAFEDITRFYGGGSVPTPFTPSDHKPIFETVTERPVRPTPPPILISPTAVTLRTPEDVLRIPEEFHASALVDQGDNDDKASGYAFGYRVRDFHTGNDYGHTQNRDLDGVTRGQYHILLPDGRVQNVRYTADDDGFHAQITYDSVHAKK